MLLLSPERLNNPDFRDNVMPQLAATCGLLVVDEAHCISDWGHDFRPDFRRLRTLLPELPAGIPVLATTATANTRVVDDVADVLGLGQRPEHAATAAATACSSCAAASTASRCTSACSRCPTPRTGWPGWPTTSPSSTGSGIIYTLTVAASQDVADYLRGRGFDVAAYSGQTEQGERLAAEDDLLQQPGQGADRDLGAGHGVRQARPRVRHPLRRAVLAHRLLPAGRAGPGAASTAPR